VTHSHHFLRPDDISDPSWDLSRYDRDQTAIAFMVAIAEDWGAKVLVEFTFEDVVDYCLVYGGPSL
jgi:hypothetical protein